MNEVLKDENAKREFIHMIFEKHEEELKNEVREYVKRNGGQEHGWIIFPVHGRIEVKAKMPYHSLINTQSALRDAVSVAAVIHDIGAARKQAYETFGHASDYRLKNVEISIDGTKLRPEQQQRSISCLRSPAQSNIIERHRHLFWIRIKPLF